MAEKSFNIWKKNFSWDYFAILIILSFGVLQVTRWIILPQFMDIYYHLLTAWGFIQSGGYSGWDFWQYAPVGRVHIYPPFLHIFIALFIKIGVNQVILAKTLEMIMPVSFLFAAWSFIRKNYSQRLAFFVILLAVASFSFYMNLINHIPATMAMIFGILAFDQILQGKSRRAVILITLCFYTHIGISWFIFLSVLSYGLFNLESRKRCLSIAGCALILAIPVIFKQTVNIGYITSLGISLNEANLLQLKIIEYILAFFGLKIVFKLQGKYKLFLSFFISSLIFLIYPYRFFSAEGYFPIIFLAAVALDSLYEKNKLNRLFKSGFAVFLLFIFFLSPTVICNNSIVESPVFADSSKTSANAEGGSGVDIKEENRSGRVCNFKFAHSAFMGMIFPLDNKRGFSNSIWFPKQYLSAADFIRKNSEENDILYCTSSLLGVCLASLSERATANGLFPEINVSKPFNPFLVSKLIIITKDKDISWISKVANDYKLIWLGENKLFIFYKNPASNYKMLPVKAFLPFWAICLFGFLFVFIFFLKRRLNMEVFYPSEE